jgi:Methyltransferase domain
VGLGFGFLADLVTLKRSGVLEGRRRVMEIGSQQIADNMLEADELLEELYGLFGKPRIRLGDPSKDNFTALAPPAEPFWTSLGFSYAAIDYNGHRNSTALDLNTDEVPRDLRGQFDLVINTGTTEHVANQGNAFRVIHDLSAVGGVMYHEVPAGSWDHGLINYGPKFFQYLQEQNSYEQVLYRGRRDVDMTIRSALRKRDNSDFVIPLDVPRELLPLKQRVRSLAGRIVGRLTRTANK